MTSAPVAIDPVVTLARQYAERLLLLSQGSVDKHFDPFADIDWDNPDFEVRDDDPRWILPKSGDMLGRHPWYIGLTEDRKIEIGLWRQANIAKVGLQFETLLIGGMVQHTFKLPNGDPEFRYCTHEVIEECNHTLMFQEMVNRIGRDVPGMNPLLKTLTYVVPPLAALFPNLFFTAVLSGEEPIDHIQKAILRADEDVHPIMRGVMAIHIAEEARHISFAHEFLEHHVPQSDPLSKFVLSLAFPIVMWIGGRAILVPPRAFFQEFGIPRSVRKDVWFGLPDSKETFASYYGDVRTLAKRIGLMNPVAKRVWKVLGIDGPTTRYRSEPERPGQVRAA
ncbi:AurF N-oxygenase family protein [Nocardia huaxiensis]|uniref:Diiron oxygenase n=1 Tax=Nocardia huaxiensis TaxID=2755382 RepID=A0A7D6Z3Z3_9NOCA|nr:diiron oxygenase [Nocardia huaxiensis]QLY30564.1 diiron oxygenase [Nocardia huaxiensis]UFS95833.1 diiron oxygenase [Nocardia huaxiensis]